MLCIRCGTDVGEKSGLCSGCAATSGESTGRGSAIGSITPVQKFVHLEPGQSDPRTAQTQPRGEPANPVANAAPLADSPPLNRSQDTPTQSRVHTAPKLAVPSKVTMPELTPEPSGPVSTIPLLAHDGFTSYYETATAQFDPAKGIVDIRFQYIPNPAGRPGVAVRSEALERTDPQLSLSLCFKKGTTKFDSDALEGYAIVFMLYEQSIRVAKTYSKRLATFGEVSQFSGELRPGARFAGRCEIAAALSRLG